MNYICSQCLKKNKTKNTIGLLAQESKPEAMLNV